MIIIDGGKGLMSALPLVYPRIPLQRCWAHKVRNVLNYVRKGDYKAVKRSLQAITRYPTSPGGPEAAQRALGVHLSSGSCVSAHG
jgi:putative transposase